MINKEVSDLINEIMPYSTAMSFDNVGLLVGSMDKEVTGIVVCLDITEEVVNEAKTLGANLIVSHHPIIFNGFKSISNEQSIYKLIGNNMSAICCHTNFDMCEKIGVNRALADKLGFEKIYIPQGTEYMQTDIEETDTESLARLIREKFPERVVQYSNLDKKIKRVAMCSGSGSGAFAGLLPDVDAFVTGEIKHDQWLEAREKNIVVFAFGHYETEHIAVPYMAKYLKENLSGVEINISQKEVNPVKYL